MKVVKEILRKNNKSVFRVNTNIYPLELVTKTFGKGKVIEEYTLYELDLSEKEVYEKFAEMLEALV